MKLFFKDKSEIKTFLDKYDFKVYYKKISQ